MGVLYEVEFGETGSVVLTVDLVFMFCRRFDCNDERLRRLR